MLRIPGFIAAVLLTLLPVSTCIANPGAPLRFTLAPDNPSGRVELSLKRSDEHHSNDWSSSFAMSELAGLDSAGFRAAGTRPVRFSISRDAGRIDCTGNGGNSLASGTCTVTADASFDGFLRQHGIAQPREDETYGLIALDVHRSLVESLSAARYPAATAGKLMELTAVGVTPDYIRSLAAAGYLPSSLDLLTQVAAMKISSEFIGSFARAGYPNLTPEELVQLKALSITPEFAASFDRLGYGRLPVDTLVQLKATGVTSEFVRSVQQGGTLPSPQHLVELRAMGRELRNR